MSGTEAAAFLSLISSIVTVIDATKKVYDAATNTKGLPSEFREVAGRLPIVQTILKSAKQQIDGHKIDEESCLASKSVMEACKEKAKKLEVLFQEVLPPDDASAWERYFKAVKTLGKGTRVETLMKGMLEDLQLLANNDGMQTVVQDHVQQIGKAIEELSEIHSSIPESAFQDTAFSNNNYGNGPMTNYNVQGDQYSQTNTGSGKQFQAREQRFSFDRNSIISPNYRTEVQNLFSSQSPSDDEELQESYQNEILDLIRFPGIEQRYDDIPQAHKKTFGWIYENLDLKFVEWLRNGEGVYWITGNDGSGKSTLMKYLYRDPRTRNNLPSEGKNTAIVGFFFHDQKGVPLLKTLEGLFRAVLFNILSKYRHLIPVVLPEEWERVKKENQPSCKETKSMYPKEWSLTRLKTAFKAIVTQKVLALHILLLIDGLDEFSGYHDEIIDVLSGLLSKSKDSVVRVQLCLSSRPLQVFEDAYRDSNHLEMQNLTANDIRAYVTAQFDDNETLRELAKTDPATSTRIKGEILEKSSGVFLWVTLAVRSLIEGLRHDDDMKSLESRLSRLPPGLKPLYRRMIDNIDPIYHKQTAKLFRIVDSAALPVSPLALHFANDDPKESLLEARRLLYPEILEIVVRFRQRLRGWSAGLVEMVPVRRNEDEKIIGGGQPLKVDFLHLTVKEFLYSVDTPAWLRDEIFEIKSSSHIDIVACCLRQFRAVGSLHLYSYQKLTDESMETDPLIILSRSFRHGVIYMMMAHALQAEHDLQVSMWEYLNALDNAMQTLKIPEMTPWKLALSFHWTQGRYLDWDEPEGYNSDYIAYLVTIGMRRAVVEIFHKGYRPELKEGRPLLLYATCEMAPDAVIGHLERDRVDPKMVEELLKRNCDPNQYFDSDCNVGKKTVWESVILQVWLRFCKHYFRPKEASRDLRVRWLKTIKIFLDYGADPRVVTTTNLSISGYRNRTATALAIIKEAFGDFDHPLVASVQDSMIPKIRLQQIPFLGKCLARYKRGKPSS